MNREETIKLLALIKVAYPTAFKDMDNASKQATVNMWQTTFSQTPYSIMEMAFNGYRKQSKYAPTVAEMCDELKHLHWQAAENALRAVSFGRVEDVKACELVMKHTAVYKDGDYRTIPFIEQAKQLAGTLDAGNKQRGDALIERL